MYTVLDTLSDAHWATTIGPDQGLCLSPGTFGTATGLTDPALGHVHGVWEWGHAGNKGRLVLSKQAPQTYLRRRTRMSRIWPLWRKIPVETRQTIHLGDRIKSGNSQWEIRPRSKHWRTPRPPSPSTDGERGQRKNPANQMRLLAILPLIFTLSFLMRGQWLGPVTSWLPWVIAAILPIVIYWVYQNHKKRPVLDPARLTSQASLRPQADSGAKESQSKTAWIQSGWGRKRPHRKDQKHPYVLNAKPGDIICLTGPHAHQVARWWSVQLLVRDEISHINDMSQNRGLNRPSYPHAGKTSTPAGGQTPGQITGQTPDQAPGQIPGQKPTVTIAAVTASLEPPAVQANEILILCAAYLTQAPWGTTKILTAPKQITSDSWWDQITKEYASTTGSYEVDNYAIDKTPWITKPRSIAKQWARGHTGLRTRLGDTESKTEITLDLAQAGPHALMAGTSGSGKSEALLTLVTTLCANYSPAQLALILIDYKGGSTFNRIKALPHSMGVLTDLLPELTKRALCGLEAELKRRETLFAEHQISDYEQWEKEKSGAFETLPRILIAVDEFRELAQSAPTHMSTLIRLAGQGRSLGMHLILATQRPAGVVDSTIRANCPIRIALRVADPADSYDVLGDARAAKLPHLPGMAIIEGEQSSTIRFDYLREVDMKNIVKNCQIAAQNAQVGHRTLSLWTQSLPQQLTANHPQISTPRGPADELIIGLTDPGPNKAAAALTLGDGALLWACDSNPQWLSSVEESVKFSAQRQGWSVRTLENTDWETPIDWGAISPETTVVVLKNLPTLSHIQINPALPAQVLQELETHKMTVIALGDNPQLHTQLKAKSGLTLIPHHSDPLTLTRLGVKVGAENSRQSSARHGLVVKNQHTQAFVLTSPS